MYTTELENVSQACLRAFDGSNHEARRQISKLLGTLVAFTQKVKPSQWLLEHHALEYWAIQCPQDSYWLTIIAKIAMKIFVNFF